ncbi:MAG: NAD(P)H-hydrate epimerase [Planctomycetes bacterium]|nr:NAD(P)H-hydrate epimerase [Planctomycetota bacterium]
MEIRPGASNHALSAAALRELDRRAVSEYGLPERVLLEHAGAGAANELLARFAREGRALERVAVLCGSGNNGGDGAVLARWLDAAGATVHVLVTVPFEALRGEARAAHAALHCGGIAAAYAPDFAVVRAELARCTTLVDALLGTGSRGAPREPSASWIRALAARRSEGAFVAALDVPSGFDADTGEPALPTVEADLTLSFAAPKLGFAKPGARRWLGETIVLPIGVPRVAYAGLSAAPESGPPASSG